MPFSSPSLHKSTPANSVVLFRKIFLGVGARFREGGRGWQGGNPGYRWGEDRGAGMGKNLGSSGAGEGWGAWGFMEVRRGRERLGGSGRSGTRVGRWRTGAMRGLRAESGSRAGRDTPGWIWSRHFEATRRRVLSGGAGGPGARVGEFLCTPGGATRCG